MMPMKRWITAALAASTLALAACVTVNVYFPAAAAEKAADRIIEDIWGPGQAPKPEGNEQMSLYADHVIVTCGSELGDIDLAMSPSSLVGFQSWLEAAPPGQGSARQGPAL